MPARKELKQVKHTAKKTAQKKHSRGYVVSIPKDGRSVVSVHRMALRTGKHACTVVYTGSPDSEVIAGYVKGFKYEPERREEILRSFK